MNLILSPSPTPSTFNFVSCYYYRIHVPSQEGRRRRRGKESEGFQKKTHAQSKMGGNSVCSDLSNLSSHATDFVGFFKQDSGRVWQLGALLAAFFLAYVNVSCPTPFLSDRLDARGIGNVGIGAAYASHPFGIVFSQLFTGAVERATGNANMLCCGFLLAGTATIVSAFTFHFTESPGYSLAILLALRFAAGMGEGFADTAILNLYQVLFPEVLGQVLGLSEGMIGVGYAVGPLIGGWLFSMGGFETPMIAVGVPFFFIAACVPWLVRRRDGGGGVYGVDSPSSINHDGTEEGVSTAPTERAASKCAVTSAVVTSGMFLTCLCYGSLNPLLNEYLDKELHYSDIVRGCIFGAGGLLYMVFGFCAGRWCDVNATAGNFSTVPFFCGGLAGAVGYMFCGPLPGMHISVHRSIPLVLAAGGVTTLGLALAIVGGMAILTVRAPSHSIASALFNASLNAGFAIGPLLGSAVKSATSYRWTMVGSSGLCAIGILVGAPLLRFCVARNRDGYTDIY